MIVFLTYLIWMAAGFMAGVETLEAHGVHWLLAAFLSAHAAHWSYMLLIIIYGGWNNADTIQR